MKKILFLSALVGLVFMAACNKDQAAVKDLSGTWLVKKIDETTIPFDSASTYTFNKCKLKKEEYCSFTITFPNDSTATKEYKVIEDGAVLVTRETGATAELKTDIKELTKETMVLSTTAYDITTVIEFDKR